MTQMKYIIRNRDNAAWLTQIQTEGKQRTYRYLPNVAQAKIYGTRREAEAMAEQCRGLVQILKYKKAGFAYAEDIKNENER